MIYFVEKEKISAKKRIFLKKKQNIFDLAIEFLFFVCYTYEVQKIKGSACEMSLILPITIAKDSDYPAALKKALNEFRQTIKPAIDPEVFKMSDKICKKLLDIIDLYYKPDMVKAIMQMKSIVATVLDSVPSSKMSVNNIYKLDKSAGVKLANEPYYRARINESSEDFSAEEMIHLPFAMRSKTQNSRFGIAGCPSINLCKSSFCAWIELDRPKYNQFNSSSVMIDSSVNVLNLATVNFELVKNAIVIKNKALIEDVVTIFPLIVATSFKATEEGRSFNSEYIIPQLLMQVLPMFGIDGVAYTTKKMTDDASIFPANLCLAILTKYGKKISEEFAAKFSCTNSINFSEFLQLPNSFRNFNSGADSNIHSKIMLGNTSLNYFDTDFWRYDKYLQKHSK